METIAKFIRALFFGSDGEVDKTAVQKFRTGLLWMVLGAGLLFGAIMFIGDDEEDGSVNVDETEYVETITEE